MTSKENAKPRAKQGAGYVYRPLGRSAFVLLAAVFSVLIVVDFSYTHLMRLMERKTYDLMMRSRYNAPTPDRGIVIIDDAALESLHDRDLATYCELIRLSDELWQREWGEQW